jgi:hypothetical protein
MTANHRFWVRFTIPLPVMTRLVPALHAASRHKGLRTFNEDLRERRDKTIKPRRLHNGVDGRDKPGHDGGFRLSPHQLWLEV